MKGGYWRFKNRQCTELSASHENFAKLCRTVFIDVIHFPYFRMYQTLYCVPFKLRTASQDKVFSDNELLSVHLKALICHSSIWRYVAVLLVLSCRTSPSFCFGYRIRRWRRQTALLMRYSVRYGIEALGRDVTAHPSPKIVFFFC